MTELALAVLGILGGLAFLTFLFRPQSTSTPPAPPVKPEPSYDKLLEVYQTEKRQRKEVAEQYAEQLTEEIQRQELQVEAGPSTEQVVDSLLELGKEVRDEAGSGEDSGKARVLH